MRIGIVTMPLRNNYGGILQNYALQRVLERMGHQPLTVNLLPRRFFWRYLLTTCKSALLYLIPGRRRPFVPYCERPKPQMREFVDKHIVCTRTVSKYSPKLLKEYRVGCLVVGSDQVWRPRYNKYPEDMFLRFARRADVKRVAYGASFGVGGMEFSRKQLRRCTPLLQKFDRVSVREASGVGLCREYFHTEAECVLDPTMLLTREDYADACKDVPVRRDGFLACYVLDMTEELREYAARTAGRFHLKPLYLTANREAAVSVGAWLAVFRDTGYVITDSFHGTVFSIIFEKPFVSVINRKRGAERFVSLLRAFQLEGRLMQSVNDLEGDSCNAPIDWRKVRGILSCERYKSVEFLQKALA